MKRRFIKLFSIIAMLCIAVAMFIGIENISVVLAEGESTLSITLVGDSTIYLCKGTEYKEFGATAYDTVEGDLTDSIVIDSSNVNKDTVGTYTVSYSVSNGSSQTAVGYRTIEVFEYMSDEEIKILQCPSNSSNNMFKKIIEIADGGFVACGQRTNGSYNIGFVIKYDENLNQEWMQYISYSGHNYVQDLIECVEGDLVVLSKA